MGGAWEQGASLRGGGMRRGGHRASSWCGEGGCLRCLRWECFARGRTSACVACVRRGGVVLWWSLALLLSSSCTESLGSRCALELARRRGEGSLLWQLPTDACRLEAENACARRRCCCFFPFERAAVGAALCGVLAPLLLLGAVAVRVSHCARWETAEVMPAPPKGRDAVRPSRKRRAVFSPPTSASFEASAGRQQSTAPGPAPAPAPAPRRRPEPARAAAPAPTPAPTPAPAPTLAPPVLAQDQHRRQHRHSHPPQHRPANAFPSDAKQAESRATVTPLLKTPLI